ncbi:MAG: NAD-dependent glyceraldehyde-3-phosphate dehydrogenase [Candidatus Moranbacteria bacterium GW2011_GWE2_47_10]|nr:MAG: NAD-dependent glyceraldehyde-3-phosphate dehydrogenase [Candidatus Moranbacteria bacterium GW2011_GWE2_47_10]
MENSKYGSGIISIKININSMTKIAINGFGRIGRPSLKIAFEKENLSVVAINDLTDIETVAHLLKYDSSYGVYQRDVNVDKENSELIIDGTRIKYFSEKDPKNLPWGELGVDVVLECTGAFLTKEKAQAHLDAGAKKVLMSAPPKDDTPVYLPGVNVHEYQGETIISNGSCTTNCLAPMVKVLDGLCEIEKGFMTTTHSYTNDQRVLDLPHDDLRRARAAAINIIPTSTGAAKTVGKVIKHLKGKIDGIALRVPTPVVSIVDFVCTVKNPKSAEEINEAFREAAKGELLGIMEATDKELVSMDYKMNPSSAIVDLPLTMSQENMVKVVGWYDNEWGYSNRFVEMAETIGK